MKKVFKKFPELKKKRDRDKAHATSEEQGKKTSIMAAASTLSLVNWCCVDVLGV
jgi:hypothetical protein